MDNGLVHSSECYFIEYFSVLILIVVDNGLVLITQISNRLPKENTKKHLANVVNNIANYARNNYPYPGYLDIVDTPNKVAIKVATDYINYVISCH